MSALAEEVFSAVDIFERGMGDLRTLARALSVEDARVQLVAARLISQVCAGLTAAIEEVVRDDVENAPSFSQMMSAGAPLPRL